MVEFYPAVLLKRYKRFLADVRLPDGREITIHCPNTGSMKNCLVPNSPCWYSTSASKTRKYPHTLEMVTTPSGDLAGINTLRANELVGDALKYNVIAEVQAYQLLTREVAYGNEKSRIDFVLENNPQDKRACYLEVKNVTLMEAPGQGLFPDAVSVRGSKHLRELMHMVQQGHRAVLLYCVQHTGIKTLSPADAIDPVYGKTLREAMAAGVEVIAYGAALDPSKGVAKLQRRLQVNC